MNNDLSGKKLLILGGTQISCEIIEKAKNMGIITIVADYNSIDNSPGKQIADESFVVSATDVEAVVKLIKEQNIDGVLVGFNDMLLPYYAEICNKANLPSYGNKEQFEIFINKEKYKTLCRKYGIPTVEEYKVAINNFEKDVESIQFPVLIKPVDNSGSRGIFICHNKEELYENCQKVLEYTALGEFLVERYLEGNEVTVFFVFIDGHYYLTGIGNRHVKKYNDGFLPLPVGYTYPASVTDSYIKNIFPNVQNMLRDAGIQNGMMFMQCKVENGVVVVYDIGFRLTASLEYRMFEAACGYNPLEMMIRYALTGKMSEDGLNKNINPHLGKYGYNISFLAEPGTIREIKGIKETKDIEGVSGVVIAHKPGETINESVSGLLSQIAVRVIGVAKDKEELCEKIENIQNLIKIISTKDEDMVHRKMVKTDFDNVLEIL